VFQGTAVMQPDWPAHAGTISSGRRRGRANLKAMVFENCHTSPANKLGKHAKVATTAVLITANRQTYCLREQ